MYYYCIIILLLYIICCGLCLLCYNNDVCYVCVCPSIDMLLLLLLPSNIYTLVHTRTYSYIFSVYTITLYKKIFLKILKHSIENDTT